MKLHNTRTRQIEEFSPLDDKQVKIYSCGPTVYDHIHIGNLSAFIAADTLRRVISKEGYQVQHVMNFTDVDDKTIKRSQESYSGMSPEEALAKLTQKYEKIFLSDMKAIGNDVQAMDFIRATESIKEMQQLIEELYKQDIAYLADDGIYFSIEKYREAGKTYGQLVELTADNTSAERIQNDEYDKESVHDFALWKTRKGNEPAWDFELDGHNLLGRPGWHIECSAMSESRLGKPFDIHTGGIDLIFPHHENEIAQSTAIQDNPMYASFFVHNEHVLVNGRKMSKSLNNFYTLQDVLEHQYEPLAFRLMILQAHYRSQVNFTWESLEAAQNRLHNWRAVATLRWQKLEDTKTPHKPNHQAIQEALTNDLNTPQALANVEIVLSHYEQNLLHANEVNKFEVLLAAIDDWFGLDLNKQKDITPAQKDLISQRKTAREEKDWQRSDSLRDELHAQGINILDTPHGQIWRRN